jgi:hypothetical protein
VYKKDSFIGFIEDALVEAQECYVIGVAKRIVSQNGVVTLVG